MSDDNTDGGFDMDQYKAELDAVVAEVAPTSAAASRHRGRQMFGSE